MKRKASAVWEGTLKSGTGSLSADSGVLSDTPYSFTTRFENEPGTNPEELIGAAHAGCFSMALSGQLEKAGFEPRRIRTSAQVTLEQVNGDWEISGIHLDTMCEVTGIEKDRFDEITQAAKEGCPVSKALKAPITLEARLQGAREDRKAG